jgi:hypothetical protein
MVETLDVEGNQAGVLALVLGVAIGASLVLIPVEALRGGLLAGDLLMAGQALRGGGLLVGAVAGLAIRTRGLGVGDAQGTRHLLALRPSPGPGGASGGSPGGPEREQEKDSADKRPSSDGRGHDRRSSISYYDYNFYQNNRKKSINPSFLPEKSSRISPQGVIDPGEAGREDWGAGKRLCGLPENRPFLTKNGSGARKRADIIFLDAAERSRPWRRSCCSISTTRTGTTWSQKNTTWS